MDRSLIIVVFDNGLGSTEIKDCILSYDGDGSFF